MQLEKAVGKHEKLDTFKLDSLIRKFSFELVSTDKSWIVGMQYESNQKFSNFGSNFPTSFFPISFRTFEL